MLRRYMRVTMDPGGGERLLRFVGDRLVFRLRLDEPARPGQATAYLRTTLGRAGLVRLEVLGGHGEDRAVDGTAWRNIPMHQAESGWELSLTLTEPGYFRAKAFVLDEDGFQVWPDSDDVGVTVHPSRVRTANTVYCAFTRLLGATRHCVNSGNAELESRLEAVEKAGCAVVPSSGKLRDLIRELPHVVDTLGCRIIHLLPVNPTPIAYARFGRFGSPYAALDLTDIDPALVLFDQRTTAVDQFKELARAVHGRGARLFLDLVINHTGWGSWLQNHHPEWFRRNPDGTFQSPGAWGTTWEDLVELDGSHRGLWEHIAEAFLIWCRRGVDGFRCDAGYKVPMPVWRYIIARVHQIFPEVVFLLEGLGGAWADTELLLTEGGMQWAYSELFQEYSGIQVAGYLSHAHRQAQRVGTLIHYSETHDNDRLAKKGRAWSLLRNRLSALTSVSGGYGFTCGVEWLATEKIRVHGSSGLAWGNEDNLVPELSRLNNVLAEHPCFFDHARLTRLSPADHPVLALRRESAEGQDQVLVLVNLDVEQGQALTLSPEDHDWSGRAVADWVDLLGQPLPKLKPSRSGEVRFLLEPGAAYCLASTARPIGLAGEAYRRARAQAECLIKILHERFDPEDIGPFAFSELAALFDRDPAGCVGLLSRIDPKDLRVDPVRALQRVLQGEAYRAVVRWTLADRNRVLPVPPGHGLLLEDPHPFRAELNGTTAPMTFHAESVAAAGKHIAFVPPGRVSDDTRITLERYGKGPVHVSATIRFLNDRPTDPSAEVRPQEIRTVLLTNGRGAMARLNLDFGRITSKYDCLLAANLHPTLPVDRHILAKRARLWVNAFGFISPLNAENLIETQVGPPARWRFRANAGDGRTVDIEVMAAMAPHQNRVDLTLTHVATGVLPGAARAKKASGLEGVRTTVRIDIEDRNFHWETKRHSGTEQHFQSNTHPLPAGMGFVFAPAKDRQLSVVSDTGTYHPAPEWCDHIPHPVEASRGQEASGDAFSPGWFDLPLDLQQPARLTVSAEPEGNEAEDVKDLGRLDAISAQYLEEQLSTAPTLDPFAARLTQASRAFIVQRDDVKTVIAGYPWFLDWGRDTLICARGLIAAGSHEIVRELLIAFGRFEERGTLPNINHGETAGNRDTTDAPLWFGLVCEELAAAVDNPEDVYRLAVNSTGRTVQNVLTSIGQHYWQGTPNGIHADPESALLWSPSHFTWMDTNHPAGTPREGYPVEIQALWIRLLRQLARLNAPTPTESWRALAQRAEASWRQYFWLENHGYLADALLAGPKVSAARSIPDTALRSNMLFGVSLGLLKGDGARRCVNAAQRHLLIPGALRSLAPLPVHPPLPIHAVDGRLLNRPDEPYCGRYEGDEDTQRKPAYHNGTAWVWTLPSFCEALALAWNEDPAAVAAARAYLASTDHLLARGCVEQLPEILDGDAPHLQRGCDAQAWSVTETLRVWLWLQARRNPAGNGS